ncbi:MULTISPECIES: MerR family transcriptional regulator [unclassified Crossiella]|uniref:MerR family transcriptional regulator n=1 Tax=unclassified Crossiella TaxID=2620835 RepID=UPI002000287E|nr:MULTISPECIES: MerR family transcriptional regulator [unclassified Crossiella]MCK2239209.1 MerR family transcriptional regulator [Crossiella sp. S99.2]MCK2251222.1 MerR family transcriptional regulator [Crossiella sp. S99.1]
MTNGVTIGQAAAFVGITIKTVRHYHRHGLVDEPQRDSSGYRRYGSAELLRLVQVRTLATAGVPLAEIRPLLDAGTEQFAAALDDVKRRLTKQIEDLTARRDTLHRLTEGDRALLPERALALLDRLAELGMTAADLAIVREGLVLARALVPEDFDTYLGNVAAALDDPRFVELQRLGWASADWDPDDPRLDELATATAEHYLANPARLAIVTAFQGRTDPAARHGLISYHNMDKAPAWTRLTALTEAKLRAAGVPIPGR